MRKRASCPPVEEPPSTGKRCLTRSRATVHPLVTVSTMEIQDLPQFLKLQDTFTEEHYMMTKDIYDRVTVRDWQRALVLPERILADPGGRERHATAMILGEDVLFKGLTILKATERQPSASSTGRPDGSGGSAGGSPGPDELDMVGYMMYQVCGEEVGTASPNPVVKNKGRCSEVLTPSGLRPYVVLKQIFVHPERRRQGYGNLLFAKMEAMLSPAARKDIRLSVLDLNSAAVKWYWKIGFHVEILTRDWLGKRELDNIILYQDMQRLQPNGAGVAAPPRQLRKAPPRLFRQEVIDEVVTIEYPEQDGGGSFEVRITGYNEGEQWHTVDSKDLSWWDGEDFKDEVDLNRYFCEGRLRFKRPLSIVFKDALLGRREDRKKATEDRAAVLASRVAAATSDRRGWIDRLRELPQKSSENSIPA